MGNAESVPGHMKSRLKRPLPPLIPYHRSFSYAYRFTTDRDATFTALRVRSSTPFLCMHVRVLWPVHARAWAHARTGHPMWAQALHVLLALKLQL